MRYITIITGLVLTLSATLLVGCGAKLPSIKPYKMEIQQGNVVTSKMLLQLRPGMTKSQVRFIMGTPLIVDSFHENRWDYFYQLRQEGKVTEKRRVILDFDKDALVSVRGDVVAASDKTAEAPTNTAPKSVTPPKKEESKSWFDKLKFWGGDEEKTAEVPVVAAAAAVAAKEAISATESAGVVPSAPAIDSATKVDSATTEATESILKKEVELPAPKEEISAASPDVPSTPITAAISAPIEEKAMQVDQPEAAQKAEVAANTATLAEAPAEKVVVQQVNSDEASKQAVMAALNTWADAWRNKDFNQYVNAYANDFRPDGLTSHKAWVAQRKARVAKRKDDISLALEDVTTQVSGNKATIQFFQRYTSKVYSDEVTKQLDFELDPKTNRWLIVKEFVVADGKRASVHKILAPDGTDDHLEGVIEKIGF
ncbi:MAG: outer membrane protein assembly factor BamE domain-containing protein [Methylophilus sp.]